MKFPRNFIGVCKTLFPGLIEFNIAVIISVALFEDSIIVMKEELQFSGI
jgi:hypothetical protein